MSDSKNLGMAYNLKKQAGKKKPMKKMAKGGMADESANTEVRPSPEERDKDSHQVSRNSGDKPSRHDGALDRSTVAQAQSNNGRKVNPIKHPRMVPSSVFSTKLQGQEDDLMDLGSQDREEKGPDRHGPMVPALKMKRMAEGGKINKAVPMSKAEEDHVMHPAGLEQDNDQMRPAKDEYMEGHFAEGGEVSAHDEMIMDHADSIAAAIMAKKERHAASMSDSDMDEMQRLYKGGEVNGMDSMESDDSDMADLSRNAEEDANMEDQASFDALRKENYSESEGLEQLDSPEDSSRHGHEIDSDKHDMAEKISRRIAARRQFKQR